VTNTRQWLASLGRTYTLFSPFFSPFPRSRARRYSTTGEKDRVGAQQTQRVLAQSSDDILAGPQIGSLDNPRAGGWLI